MAATVQRKKVTEMKRDACGKQEDGNKCSCLIHSATGYPIAVKMLLVIDQRCGSVNQRPLSVSAALALPLPVRPHATAWRNLAAGLGDKSVR
jgi:hypothetical protein